MEGEIKRVGKVGVGGTGKSEGELNGEWDGEKGRRGRWGRSRGLRNGRGVGVENEGGRDIAGRGRGRLEMGRERR